MGPYVSFVIDLAGNRSETAEGDVRIVSGTVRFAPSKTPTPQNAFQWKVSVNAEGHVTVRSQYKKRVDILALAVWEDGALARQHQAKADAPTAYQWNLVRDAVREALRMASTATPPATSDESDDAPASLWRTMPRTSESLVAHGALLAVSNDLQRRSSARRPVNWWIVFAVGAPVVLGFLVPIACAVLDEREAKREVEDRLAAAATPEIPPEPASVAVPLEVDASAPPTVETAASFAEATGIARASFQAASIDDVSPGAAQLARYRRLQWSDVDGAVETTLPRVEKDAQTELGKRLCAEGVITWIARRDLDQAPLPPRKAFVGRLVTDDKDEVAFVVTGTTGELVKRSRARVCGVVTGLVNDRPAIYGLFDLPENASPLVEQ